MYLPTRVEYLSMNINDPEGISVLLCVYTITTVNERQ